MAKILYYNGSILTMDKGAPRAEALLCEGDKILAVGDLAELEKIADGAKRVDLGGKTLMPAFVDAHSHLMTVGASLKKCDLSECTSFAQILQAIAVFREKNHLTHGEWISCFGYDLALLKEGTHPTAALLDSLGFDNPIGCMHASLHMGVFSSAAMRQCGIDDSYVCGSGGVVGRDENGHLTGYFEEEAKQPLVAFMNKSTAGSFEEDFCAAQEYYFSYGIATMQDGGSVGEQAIENYKRLADEGKIRADVVLYLSSRPKDEGFWGRAKAMLAGTDKRLRIGGVKIYLDGSPQAKTAWMRKPYEHEESYCGYPTQSDETVYTVAERAERQQMQLMAHCNGDAAAEQFISAFEKVLQGGRTAKRPVMIHAQTVGYDQLDRMAKIGMMPSFFVGHCYYWGDTHLHNFGWERGSRISPVRAALERGLPFNFHQDSPVTRPDMLHSVWCAVNRVTRSGVTVGEENKIDVYDALIAVTNGAAYAYFEENIRGILKPGAVCDLVILDRDPTAVPPMEIKDIKVLQTVKGGETVFSLRQ